MKNKLFTTLLTVLSFVGFSVAAHAQAVALDSSVITGAVDFTTIAAAIAVLAGVKFVPGALKWGYNKLIGWFR